VADAMKLRKILLLVWIAPFCGSGLDMGGGGGFTVRLLGLQVRENVPLTRILACALERQDASLWTCRYMSLVV
jgi:hypothetical protein